MFEILKQITNFNPLLHKRWRKWKLEQIFRRTIFGRSAQLLDRLAVGNSVILR